MSETIAPALTAEDMQRFCTDDEFRPSMMHPFSIGESTFATDGFIVMRIPRLSDVPEYASAPRANEIVDQHTRSAKLNWLPIPAENEWPKGAECEHCGGSGTVEQRPLIQCPECDGDCDVEYDNGYHSYEMECKTCEGEGEIENETADPEEAKCADCSGRGTRIAGVLIGCSYFADAQLRRISNLPCIEISPSDTLKPAPFRFDGGDGIIMPMRRPADV